MPTPTYRTPVRIARGPYANLILVLLTSLKERSAMLQIRTLFM